MPVWARLLLAGAGLLATILSMGIAASMAGKAGGAVEFLSFPVFGFLWLNGPYLLGTSVQIGADGILTRWMGRERFHSFANIAWVGPYEGIQSCGVELTLRGGERVRIATNRKYRGGEQGVFLQRIHESAETYWRGAAADTALLARNGRKSKDWVTALKAIGAGANADMRTPAITHERLWCIIEDSRAEPLARVGAAIALAPQVHPSERGRIRVAVESTVAPKLRVALEQASSIDASDEALVEAIEHLEAEGGATGSSARPRRGVE
jgi:hypothetical protein